MHLSQSVMLLQHLAGMTGGFIGRTWHMVHIKEPWNSFCSPSGRLVAESVVHDFNSLMSSLIVLMSDLSCLNSSSFLFFPTGAWCFIIIIRAICVGLILQYYIYSPSCTFPKPQPYTCIYNVHAVIHNL